MITTDWKCPKCGSTDSIDDKVSLIRGGLLRLTLTCLDCGWSKTIEEFPLDNPS